MKKIAFVSLVATILLLSVRPSVRPKKNDNGFSPASSVLASFSELQDYIEALSDAYLRKGLRNSLVKKLDSAEASYQRGQPCVSLNILEAYLNHARALSHKASQVLMDDLYFRGVLLRNDVMASLPQGFTCPREPELFECYEQTPWPDLLPQSMSTNPAQPYKGEGADVELMVINRGGQPAYEVSVAFSTDGQEFTTASVDYIAPCGKARLSVFWPGDDEGPHLIRAVIDPDGLIEEGSKVNNSTELEVIGVFELIRPWDPSDLVADELEYSPQRPVAGDTITLEARIKNKTRIKSGEEGPLPDILIRFLIDGEEMDRTVIPELVADEEVTVSGTWSNSTAGRHYLTVQAVLPDHVPERDPTNNIATGIVNVGGMTTPLPDLHIEDISLFPSVPELGETVQVSAIIKNIGWAAAENLWIYVVADGGLAPPSESFSANIAPAHGGYPRLLIERLEPAESTIIQTTLKVMTAGEHTVSLEIDPEDLVPKEEAPTIFAKPVAIPTSEALCLADQTIWTSLGPKRLTNGSSGRVDNVLIHPYNQDTMYIGAPTGGVWKTTNGGTTWSPTSDFMPSLDISAMAMDPTAPNIIYAGSGAGIFKTINGGADWSVFIDTTVGTSVEDLIIRYEPSSTTNFTIFAGTNEGVWRYDGTNKNLKKSKSEDWKRIKTGIVTGLIQHPTSPSQFFVGIYKKGVYRSIPGADPSGDSSWEFLSDGQYGLPSTVSGSARIAISANQPEVLYAGIHTPGMYELYRTDDGGDTWKKRFGVQTGLKWVTPTVAQTGSYWENWYNDYVVVDPTNADIIYIGHIQAYRSENGGLTFTRIQGIHDDQHGYGFHPGDATTLYLLGDGGIFKCTSKGASCDSLNGDLRNMMFFDIALSNTNIDVILGGTQDNGTIATKGSDVWTMLRGGDGRYVAVDPWDYDVIYSQHQYLGDTAKAADWFATFKANWRAAPGLPKSPGAGVPPEEVYLGDPYFLIHPTDPDLVLAAGPETYKHPSATDDWTQCPNCDSWVTIGPNPQNATGVAGAVKRITVDPNTNIYYAGMTSGQIWAGLSGGSSWHKIFTHLNGRGVTGLTLDPADTNRLFATFSGSGTTDGPLKVWLIERIESGGDDLNIPGQYVFWKKTNITGNLNLDLKIGSGWRMSNMIVVDPVRAETVYVATEKGVYRGRGTTSENGDSKWNWQPFNCKLPWVNVTDLEIHPITKELFAATYGRGLFVTPLLIIE